ncbi:hypothetical protein BU16DRAFT_74219 [Lophium mytilinum]|uniref:Uncharacterized protein n=1 Tax=Lophium mytilinum TaxID=390894 RepID=A0A6A6QM88_9PEZI|nr:hypothetical protein BU16DRAFT_74219 [Lophium mytilinum]
MGRPEGADHAETSARESIEGGVPGIPRDEDRLTIYLRTHTSEVDVSEIRTQAMASESCWPRRSTSPTHQTGGEAPQRQSSVHGEADSGSNPRSVVSESEGHTNGYHSPGDHDSAHDSAHAGSWSGNNDNGEGLEGGSSNDSNTDGEE